MELEFGWPIFATEDAAEGQKAFAEKRPPGLPAQVTDAPRATIGRRRRPARRRLAAALRPLITLTVAGTFDDGVLDGAADRLEAAGRASSTAGGRDRSDRAASPTSTSTPRSSSRPARSWAWPTRSPRRCGLRWSTGPTAATGDPGQAWFDCAYEGPPTCVHGGVIAETFDEMLGAANMVAGNPGMTGTLTVRYRKPTPLRTDRCASRPGASAGTGARSARGPDLPRRRADGRGRRPVHRGRPSAVAGHRRGQRRRAPTPGCWRPCGPRPSGRRGRRRGRAGARRRDRPTDLVRGPPVPGAGHGSLARRAGDAAAIAAVHVASWRAAYPGLLPDRRARPGCRSTARPARGRGSSADASASQVVVAEADGGWSVRPCRAGPRRRRRADDGSAGHPLPRTRDLGAGRRAGPLHDAALDRLVDAGYDAAVLWMLSTNDRARRFYERQGWAQRRGPAGPAVRRAAWSSTTGCRPSPWSTRGRPAAVLRSSRVPPSRGRGACACRACRWGRGASSR